VASAASPWPACLRRQTNGFLHRALKVLSVLQVTALIFPIVVAHESAMAKSNGTHQGGTTRKHWARAASKATPAAQ